MKAKRLFSGELGKTKSRGRLEKDSVLSAMRSMPVCSASGHRILLGCRSVREKRDWKILSIARVSLKPESMRRKKHSLDQERPKMVRSTLLNLTPARVATWWQVS